MLLGYACCLAWLLANSAHTQDTGIPVHQWSHTDEATGAGSIGSARNLEGLKKRGITHVLNASPIVPRFHKRHFSYMTIQVYDDVDEDIARFFHQAACFIARVSICPGLEQFCFLSRGGVQLYPWI